MAGAEGIGPSSTVLETAVLPLNHAPSDRYFSQSPPFGQAKQFFGRLLPFQGIQLTGPPSLPAAVAEAHHFRFGVADGVDERHDLQTSEHHVEDKRPKIEVISPVIALLGQMGFVAKEVKGR